MAVEAEKAKQMSQKFPEEGNQFVMVEADQDFERPWELVENPLSEADSSQVSEMDDARRNNIHNRIPVELC